jgi:hypothetical protein
MKSTSATIQARELSSAHGERSSYKRSRKKTKRNERQAVETENNDPDHAPLTPTAAATEMEQPSDTEEVPAPPKRVLANLGQHRSQDRETDGEQEEMPPAHPRQPQRSRSPPLNSELQKKEADMFIGPRVQAAAQPPSPERQEWSESGVSAWRSGVSAWRKDRLNARRATSTLRARQLDFSATLIARILRCAEDRRRRPRSRRRDNLWTTRPVFFCSAAARGHKKSSQQ